MEYTILESFIMMLLWIFAIYGITQIVTEASIFNPIREYFTSYRGVFGHFGSLISCFLCSSVWVSAGVSLILFSPTTHVFPELHNPVAIVFFDAMIGSTLAWFLYVLENRIS